LRAWSFVVIIHDVMPRPICHDLTEVQKRVARALAEFVRKERPALVSDLVKALGLAGESSLTPTLLKMQRSGFIEVQRGGEHGRSRVVVLTAKGRTVLGIGGLPLLGSIPAGLVSEAIAQAGEMVEAKELLGQKPGDFLLRVRGDSMVGDGIFDGDLVLLRPNVEVPNGAIAAVCVGEEREGTLKRVFFEVEETEAEGEGEDPVEKPEPASGTAASGAGCFPATVAWFGNAAEGRRLHVRLRAANPAFPDVLVPAERVSFAGLLKGVVRHVGARG
jgi:repressor LexA